MNRLDPAGPILARLSRFRNSKEVIEVSGVAGITFDLLLNERDNYSHSTRIREFLTRIGSRLASLPEQERRASLGLLAGELVRRGAADEDALRLELERLGWAMSGSKISPLNDEEHSGPRSPISVGSAAMTVPGTSGAPSRTVTDAANSPASGRALRSAVVLTALPLESQAIIEHLVLVREVDHARGTVYTCGILAEGAVQWNVAVVTAGMGNSGAALEVERAVSLFTPEIVLLVGIAGGVKDVDLGDVVAADRVHHYEKGKAGEAFLPRPESWSGGYAAVQRARRESMKNGWQRRIKGPAPQVSPKVIVKPIAAGEKVVASERADVYNQIRTFYGDAVAVEMEGAGFLLATHANAGTESLVIRGISDLIEHKAETDAEGWQAQAARNAAAFAAEFLLHYRSSATTGTPLTTNPGTEQASEVEHLESYDPAESTAFFHNRICGAFPGCGGLCEENDPAIAVQRLGALLKAPLDYGSQGPMWQVDFGTSAITSFAAGEGDIVYLSHRRYRLLRLVAYRPTRYWHDFVLMYWRADEPSGLYPLRSAEEIADSVARMDRCQEEFAIWNGQLITRQEYDDDAVFRDGRLQEVSSAQLEVRQLATGVTFLVGQLSPVNEVRNDGARWTLLRDHLSGAASVRDIADWVESLYRHVRERS